MTIRWIISILGFALFAFLHSLLASHSLKNIIFKRWPVAKAYYRIFYNIFALLTLGIWYYFSVPLSERVIYTMPIPFSYIGYLIQLIALYLIIKAAQQFGAARFLGIQQLQIYNNENILPEYYDENRRGEMVKSGMYRWMRHPLYSFSLLFLISNPEMTIKWFVMILIFGAYFWIGSHFEEKKLVIRFGEEYKTYQKEVPRLIPWKIPKSRK